GQPHRRAPGRARNHGMPGPSGMGSATPGHAARQRRLHRTDPPARATLALAALPFGRPKKNAPWGVFFGGTGAGAYLRTPRSLGCDASQAATCSMSWSDNCAANAPMMGFLRTFDEAGAPAAPRLYDFSACSR